MKGRIVWVFWLVVVLAALTATASYAWLAMNTEARLRGFEVELESDSIYLEISAEAEGNYGTEVSLERALYRAVNEAHEVRLISYGVVPDVGAILLYPTKISENNAPNYGDENGNYNGGTRRFYVMSTSVIGGEEFPNFIDVTDTLVIGQKLTGYYAVNESSIAYKTSQNKDRAYYVKNEYNGEIDYSCIGKFAVGETLAGRMYWGHADSSDENDPQKGRSLNVVSIDTPYTDTEEFCLKRTVYLRGAENTVNLKNLEISSINIEGRRNYLTDAIRILFVATSDRGRSVTKIYNPREPENFNKLLFEEVFGNAEEIITVDMYIYFDGEDQNAHNNAELLTSQTVSVKFTVADHEYN